MMTATRKKIYWLVLVVMMATLACATNTPVAQRATPRPTRTPMSTFTNTPLPPTATAVPTQTPTPNVTATPTPTASPVPTDTPPLTDTPLPTDIPPPTNTSAPAPPPPPPPTDTPEPEPTAAPVADSPVATPVPTSAPGSPPGEYQPKNINEQANCAHVGVIGYVRDGDDDDDPRLPGVTVQVTGNEDGFRGPYLATTDQNGEYGMVIAEFGNVPERVEFLAEIVGPDVKTEDRPKWKYSDDCNEDDANQIMNIIWSKIR